MKRLIIITILLLAAAVTITVAYFSRLNPPGKRTSQIINTIPNNAALIFGFNNDAGFYDIYDSSALLSSVTGPQKIKELQILRRQLLNNSLLKPYLAGQNIYISIHPQANDSLEYLITMPVNATIPKDIEAQFTAQQTAGLKIKAVTIGGRPGYTLQPDSISKPFYIVYKGDNVYTGSFSEALAIASATYKPGKKTAYTLLPDQQNSNSLATLYVNYEQLHLLLNQLYKQENADVLGALQALPAMGSLSLNYKSDALMFNGFSTINNDMAASYLNIFRGITPVDNQIKDLFPVTTAYSSSFAVETGSAFEKLLTEWQQKAGLDKDRKALFQKIKAETGVNFDKEFTGLLGNEFAIVTTRFQEKIAIIKLTNGSRLQPYISNIATMAESGIGKLNYDRLPFYLLGDPFNIFRHPYFRIADNYLILGNTENDVKNYFENYTNSRFLSVNSEFQAFDELLAQRCNAAFFIHFKNAGYIFKRALKKNYAEAYQQLPGFKNYYAASYQLTASDNDFYTNFCMKLNRADTAAVSRP